MKKLIAILILAGFSYGAVADDEKTVATETAEPKGEVRMYQISVEEAAIRDAAMSLAKLALEKMAAEFKASMALILEAG